MWYIHQYTSHDTATVVWCYIELLYAEKNHVLVTSLLTPNYLQWKNFAIRILINTNCTQLNTYMYGQSVIV